MQKIIINNQQMNKNENYCRYSERVIKIIEAVLTLKDSQNTVSLVSSLADSLSNQHIVQPLSDHHPKVS